MRATIPIYVSSLWENAARTPVALVYWYLWNLKIFFIFKTHPNSLSTPELSVPSSPILPYFSQLKYNSSLWSDKTLTTSQINSIDENFNRITEEHFSQIMERHIHRDKRNILNSSFSCYSKQVHERVSSVLYLSQTVLPSRIFADITLPVTLKYRETSRTFLVYFYPKTVCLPPRN